MSQAEKNGAPFSSANLPLFLEDIYDALRAIVQHLNGPKADAAKLWPHKSADQGRKELLDALNRDNPRKLDPEEVLALLRMGREADFHQAKHWIDATLGYAPGQPVDAETELAGLLREYLALENRQAVLRPKIEDVRMRLAK